MTTEEFKKLEVLERPLEKINRLYDGIRQAVISNAWFDIEDEDSEKPLLVFKIYANDEYGVPVKILLPIYYNWADEHFTELLEKLGVMPTPGESIPLRNFIGIDVMIMVKNFKNWNGKTETRITAIKKDMVFDNREEQQWAIINWE